MRTCRLHITPCPCRTERTLVPHTLHVDTVFADERPHVDLFCLSDAFDAPHDLFLDRGGPHWFDKHKVGGFLEAESDPCTALGDEQHAGLLKLGECGLTLTFVGFARNGGGVETFAELLDDTAMSRTDNGGAAGNDALDVFDFATLFVHHVLR